MTQNVTAHLYVYEYDWRRCLLYTRISANTIRCHEDVYEHLPITRGRVQTTPDALGSSADVLGTSTIRGCVRSA